MQLRIIFVALAAVTGAVADLHGYANCFSRIEPYGQDHSCSAKRDLFRIDEDGEIPSMKKRGYADHTAATHKACHAYKARHTGSNHWDHCPDCNLKKRSDSATERTYCVMTCNSAAKHIGGDEWTHYCKKFGADGGEAY